MAGKEVNSNLVLKIKFNTNRQEKVLSKPPQVIYAKPLCAMVKRHRN
jgi:hypothetical protein